MKTNIGVWIDQREAYIIAEPDQKIIHHIHSGFDEAHEGGHHAGTVKKGNHVGFAESKMVHRKEELLHKFFMNVIDHLPEVDELFIFGPGEAKKLFKKEVEKIPALRSGNINLETADKLSENKMRERVREFFAQPIHSKRLPI